MHRAIIAAAIAIAAIASAAAKRDPAQIEAFNAMKARYVHTPFPAWTAIDVDRLAPESGVVEIRVVAKRAT